MSLPLPDLDDKTFEELLEEAKKLIPLYAPEWTDHNLHDPGITFIEHFAWLTEMQLYSLNRITDRHLLKYLGLLGIRPSPATPSRVDVQITSDDFKTISAGTPLKTVSASSEVMFETDEEIEVLPLGLKKIISYANYQSIDVTKFNGPQNTYYYALGEHPKQGDALYLGLDSEKDLTDRKVRLGIYLFEEDLPPTGQHGGEKLKAYPSAVVNWEYWNGSGWKTLKVNAIEETIIALSQSGHLSFIFPADIIKGKPPGLTDELFWLRCKLLQADYEIPPRIDRTLINIVSATQVQTVKEESMGSSSGLPSQVFNTRNQAIIAGSQKLTVDGEEWLTVNEFDASQPDDKHYVINPAKGEILFGDGKNGCIPRKGAEIKITCRHGGRARGNVGAGTITRIDIPGMSATNPLPARGGKEEESIEEAFIRFRKDLRVPHTAVTAEDYEYVASATPGLRVDRAKAVVTSENTVTVIVVPYSPLEKPIPSQGFRRTVCDHLDMHRLITTYIKIMEPGYVRISVNTEIRIKAGYSPELVRNRVNDALNRFLSPVKRKPDDNAWPFGRPVYKSEVYEVMEAVNGVDCVLEIFLRGEEGSFKYKNGNIEIGDLSLVYPGNHNIEIVEPKVVCKRGSYG
jgi:hypothetical protein